MRFISASNPASWLQSAVADPHTTESQTTSMTNQDLYADSIHPCKILTCNRWRRNEA